MINNIFLLSDRKINDVNTLPMFQINYIDNINIDFNEYDGLIFTSKNAVIACNSISKIWKDIPSYAISSKTADMVKKLDGNLVFIGSSGHGDEFANELIGIDALKNKKLLYPRGFEVLSNLQKIINNNNIICQDIVVYETTCKKYKKESIISQKNLFLYSLLHQLLNAFLIVLNGMIVLQQFALVKLQLSTYLRIS